MCGLVVELASLQKPNGRIGVRLRLKDNDVIPVLVAMGTYQRMHSLFERFSTVVPQAIDLTLNRTEDVHDDHGTKIGIEVSRAPLGAAGAGFENARFVWLTPDVAVLRLTANMWLATAVVFVLGCVMLLLAAFGSSSSDPILGGMIVGSIGAVFAFCGLIGTYGALVGRITISRVQREMVLRSLIPWRRPRRISFSEIYALQLCSRLAQGRGDGADYMVHELNMVLLNPPGERINLMSHGNSERLEKQAARLGEFLGKRILDYSE